MDSDLSGGENYPTFEQPGPDRQSNTLWSRPCTKRYFWQCSLTEQTEIAILPARTKDQGPGIDFCVGVFLGSVGKIDGNCDYLASVYQ